MCHTHYPGAGTGTGLLFQNEDKRNQNVRTIVDNVKDSVGTNFPYSKTEAPVSSGVHVQEITVADRGQHKVSPSLDELENETYTEFSSSCQENYTDALTAGKIMMNQNEAYSLCTHSSELDDSYDYVIN